VPDVAALNVVISADTKDLEAGLARAEQSVSKAGSAIQAAMGGALIAGVAGVGAALVGSVKSAADFEKQMSAVGAVAGASASEMEALTKTALQLGKDTSFSASEAAQGIEELAKAGVSMADIMGGAGRASLDLAAAGAISVAEAAEIASNAMNVFGIEGDKMAHVADVIAGAANASAIGVNDYKFSLAAAGAVANTVGISFDSLSTAIAVMGNAGIKGSDAGTSLKTMLLNLQPASKQQISLFRELGILTADGANKFFDASGKAKDFAGIAQVLQDALKGMTKQQQLATLEIMFGSDAIRAGAVLLESGAEGFNTMAEAMSKVTAQSVASERLNNLWGSVEKLKGSLETAAIILGGQFTPALKGMADAATEQVNTLIDAFEQIPDVIGTIQSVIAGDWAPDASIRPFTLAVGEAAVMLKAQFGPAIATAGAILQQLGDWFTANIAPIAAFVAGFLGAIGTAGLFTAAVAALAAVLTLLLSPIGLVAIAVGLLAAAWTTNFMGIQEATAAAWAYLLPIFTQIVEWLGPKISAVLTWLTTTGWPMMLEAGRLVGEWISTVAIPALTQLVDWLGPKLSAVVTWIYETGWPSLVTAGETVVTTVTAILTWFTDLFTALEQRGVFTELGVIWDQLVTIGGKVWAVIQKIIDVFTPFKALGDQFNTGTGALLVGTFGSLAEKAGLVASPIDTITGALRGLFAIISLQLSMVEKFIGYLEKIAAFKMPSFNLTGGSSPSGGIGTMSFSTAKGAIDNSSREAFLKSAYPYALEAAMGDAKLAQQLLATAISENGAVGTGKDLSTMGFNVGGIQGVQGTAGSFTAMDAGRPRQFAAYNNLSEGFGAVRDLITSGRYAPAYEKYKKSGDVDQFWADVGAAGYAEDPAWATKVGNIRRNQVEPVAVRIPSAGNGLGDIKISQTQWGASVGMTPQEAAAACGPYAASIFAQATGRMPNPAEAEQLARAAGWTEAGMGGTGNFMKLLGSMGVNAVRTTTGGMSAADITQMAANAGPLTAFSTPKHYFASTGFDPATQKFNVGATGTFAGGSEQMTVAEMAALGGGIQDIITLAGQMGTAFNDASAATLHASGAMATGVTTDAATMTTTIPTQFAAMATSVGASGQLMVAQSQLANGETLKTYTENGMALVATVTNTGGQIVNQWSQVGLQVVSSTINAMAGQTTVFQDAAGIQTTIVADATGRIIGSYTAMAAEGGSAVNELGQISLEQFGAVAEAAMKPIEPIENLGSALADIPQADMSDTVKQFGEAAAAAKKAQAAIKALADATEDLPGSFGGSKGGKSSGLSKKAAGGWASGLTLVGEEGPELLSLNRPHYVTPNSALSGGGGPVTVVNVSVGGSLVAQSELEDTIARAVATSLRGGSLAWSN
jgi:TP901 family phage tail tape measure protein